MMNNKKIIKEQGLGDKTQLLFRDPTLKMMVGAGCFSDKTMNPVTIGNKQAAIIQGSKKFDGYPVAALFGDFTLEYYSDVTFKNKKPEVGTWDCSLLRNLEQNSLNPELIKFVDDVRTAGTANVHNYGADLGSKKVNGTCTLTLLDDFINSNPNLKSRADVQSLLPTATKAYIWVCKQSSETSQNKALMDKYTKEYGYSVCTDAQMATIQSKQGGKNQGQVESIDFIKVGDTYLCHTDTAYAKNSVYKDLKDANNLVSQDGPNKENCRSLIENYYRAADKRLKIPQDEINLFKISVDDCRQDNEVKMDGILSKKFERYIKVIDGIGVKTSKNLDGTINTYDYALTTGSNPSSTTLRPTSQNESKEKLLKSLIRENLMTISESKKKVLIEESKIITNRFSIITEGVSVNSKKEKLKFVNELVTEAMLLNSQGFNRTLINEQFWDMMKSFFGNTGSGVVQMISERIIQAIITTLTPLDKNGWVANIIITTLGNVPPADYFNGKIFSCDYISDKLSKGIVEGMARKIQNEKGMEGPIYDVIRNSMVEMAEDTEFGMKIENMLGDLICPMLGGVKSKMDSTAETLKAKALA